MIQRSKKKVLCADIDCLDVVSILVYYLKILGL